MTINKRIRPILPLEELEVSYVEIENIITDSAVKIYQNNKLSFLLTDDLAAVVGNNVFDTVRGDFFVFCPDEIHHGRFLRSGLHRYLDFYIPLSFWNNKLFAQAVSESTNLNMIYSKNEKNLPDRINLVHPEDSDREEILRICEKVVNILLNHQDLSDHSEDMLIFALFIELMELSSKAYMTQKSHPQKTSIPSVVSKTIIYINDNYSEQISLSDLSIYCGCSVTYLTRTFKKHTGQTIHRYLTERRIEYAQKLLREGATVTEACYASGFSNCSNFIKVFKKVIGTTPKKLELPQK